MKATIRAALLPALLSVALASLGWAEDYSHVRIVRLSFTQGIVSLQRPGSTDWSKAPINTPIEEGFKLSTNPGSFAEVEFENGSTARIGEQSVLDFTQLALEPSSGNKINRMNLQQGYGTFHVDPMKGDVYEVTAENAKIEAAPKTEFRVDLEGARLRVEVFKGNVQVSSPEGSTILTKNKVLEINPGAELAFLTTHGIKKDDWDTWVKERDEVEAGNRTPSIFRNAPAYGWSDLDDYGQWNYFPGYGYGWTPELIGGWSPFSFGQWCWYPGLGYTWISSAPWGWLPFHYGNWGYDPLAGWIWFPGAFNVWSPGTVNWYQGTGWVGWIPRGVPPAPPKTYTKGTIVTPPCQAGAGCRITTVSTEAFQNGKPVTPLNIKEMTVAGQPVSRVELPPTRTAMFAGPVVTPSFAAVRGAPGSGMMFERGARLDHSAPAMGATFGARNFPGSPAPGKAGTFGRSTMWSHRSAPAVSPRSGSIGRSMSSGRIESRGGGWSGAASRSDGGFSSPSRSVSVASPAVSSSIGSSGGGGHAGGGGSHH